MRGFSWTVTCLQPCPTFGCVFVRCDLLASCSASISASSGLRLSGDCPDEACQLACDRGGDDSRWLTCPCKLAVPPTKSFLRLPRGIADRLGQTFLPQQMLARSEEHTSELQSHVNIVCRLLL